MAGTLVIIGGHEDREGEKVILREIADRIGGKRVVVITTASEEPEEMFKTYLKAFTDLGVKEVVQIHGEKREDNLDESAAEPLKRAGAVFFTGGDQLRLTSQLGDAPVFQAIQKLYHDGGVVAGTSAGASALSDTMLVSGSSGSSPQGGDAIRMAPGFCLIAGVVVDQHFAERGRIGRLLAAVAQNPKSLGVGIDENTALVVDRSRFTVVGKGGVCVVDGSTVTFSTVADAADEQPLSLDKARLHVLALGDKFDLKHRRPLRSNPTREQPVMLLIEGGDRYDPAPLGQMCILTGGGAILKVGAITTAVGTLGVDPTMKNMPGLIGRAKALREQGITAFVWSGGHDVPPSALTGSVRNDILFIAEVIGAGEIAISDERSMDPSPRELAKLASDAFIGGHLARKAGLTHFHGDPGPERLAILRRLIDEYDVRPQRLYSTHVERTEALMDEAIDLARRGASVDVDDVEKDLAKWFRYYRERGGPPERFTASTDASISSPRDLIEQVRSCVEGGIELADVLPIVTANTARILKLADKGRIGAGADADIAVLEKGSLVPVEVVAGGRRLVREGNLAAPDPGLDGNAREPATGVLRRCC